MGLGALMLLLGALGAHGAVKCRNRGGVEAVASDIYDGDNLKQCCVKHDEISKVVQQHVDTPRRPFNCHWRCLYRTQHDFKPTNRRQYCKYRKPHPKKGADNQGKMVGGCPPKRINTKKKSQKQRRRRVRPRQRHRRGGRGKRSGDLVGQLHLVRTKRALRMRVYYCYRTCNKTSDCLTAKKGYVCNMRNKLCERKQAGGGSGGGKTTPDPEDATESPGNDATGGDNDSTDMGDTTTAAGTTAEDPLANVIDFFNQGAPTTTVAAMTTMAPTTAAGMTPAAATTAAATTARGGPLGFLGLG